MDLRVHEDGAERKIEKHAEEGEEHEGEEAKERALCQECCAEGACFWQDRCGDDKLQELWSKEGAHPTGGEDGC